MIENKSGKFGLGIFVGILIALVIGMGIFIVYDKVLNNDNANNSEDQNNTQNNNESNVVTELSISDSLVQELYSSIMFGYGLTNDYYYHNSSKTLVSDMKNYTKMYLTANKWLKEYRNNPNSDVVESNDYTLIVPEEQIKNVYYRIFGKDSVYSLNSSYNFCPIMSYEGADKIKLSLACGGGTGLPKVVQNIIKAEKTENEIYIYENVAFLNYVEDNSDGRHVYNLYKDTEKTNLVAEKVVLVGDYNELVEQYQNKLDTYKYTFKSNGDGTYYFYSVERQ